MTSTTKITLDLQTPNVAVMVFAVQNDRLSRYIEAALIDGSVAWTPPAGTLATIRYAKPDGTTGYYDTDEEGNSAISISGNKVTMTLVEQALTVPGDVWMELNMYTAAGDKLTTFRWLLRVQASVITDQTIVSSDYYNVLTALAAQIAADADAVEAAAAAITIPLPVASGGTGATSAAAARSALGLGGAALLSDPVPLANGGTGAATAGGARSALGFTFSTIENMQFYYSSNTVGIRFMASASLYYDILFTGNGITASYSTDGTNFTVWWTIAKD